MKNNNQGGFLGDECKEGTMWEGGMAVRGDCDDGNGGARCMGVFITREQTIWKKCNLIYINVYLLEIATFN